MRLRVIPCVLFMLAAAFDVQAANFRIAVVAPSSENLRILGDQIRAGAAYSAGSDIELVEIEEPCTDGSGPAVAQKIVDSTAIAAIGFLCTETVESGLDVLAKARIPAITLSVRASIPMEDALKHGWPLFRLAPSPAAEREKLTETIFNFWKDRSIAILDDGTINSRDLAESVRSALEEKGMKPTLVDTFRPAQDVQAQLVRRLAKAGVTHVFAAADRSDMAIIARDAARLKKELTLLGGNSLDALDQDIALAPGVLAVVVPEYSTLPSAKAVVDALGRNGQNADGYFLPAHAAVDIVRAAKEIADGSGAPLVDALIDTPFTTSIGTITFTRAHELAVNPMQIEAWTGSGFEPSVTMN